MAPFRVSQMKWILIRLILMCRYKWTPVEDNNVMTPLIGAFKLTIADKSLTTLIGSPHPEAGAPLRSSKNRHAGRMPLSNYNTRKEQIFQFI